MNWFLDFLRNKYLITVLVAFFTSQTIKVFTHAITYKKWDFKRIFGDGGMPSSHTATVTSFAFITGMTHGFASFAFGISMLLCLIVCRDAVGVRNETGKQSIILNELKHLLEGKDVTKIKLKEFVGHTPVQVFCGAILGFIVALVMELVVFA